MGDGKCLLVTGASSEIGMTLIGRIHGGYAHILAHYHESVENIKKMEEKYGDKVVPVQADFSDRDSICTMLQTIRDTGLEVDHIVHLAAQRLHLAKFVKEDIGRMRGEYVSSVESVLMVLQEFLPGMSKRGYGKVVFMLSSNVEGVPARGQISYSIPKYALLGLMRGIAVEYAGRGITSNAVSPAMMDTKFVSGIPELIVEQNGQANPCGRNLKAWEVAPAFEYLLSDGADKVTGANIPVTGGLL